jgi:hypothetical protein
MNRCQFLFSVLLLSGTFSGSGETDDRTRIHIGVGGDSTLIPFSLDYLHDFYGWESIRHQQVYDKRLFIGYFIDGFIIQEIEFRIARDAHTVVTTLPEIEIRMSTTARGEDTLSSIFAENIGEDEAVVYPRAPLYFSSSGFPSRVVLKEPFHYYSSQGHLLIEVRNFKTNGLPLEAPYVVGDLDSRDSLGDRTSRAYASNATAPIADVVDTQGLWTGFWGTVIPPEGKLEARRIAGGVEFSWTGAPYFRLQRTARLTPPNWATVPGTQFGGSSYVETNLGTAAFYRIKSGP